MSCGDGVLSSLYLILDMESSKPGDDVHIGREHAMGILITP